MPAYSDAVRRYFPLPPRVPGAIEGVAGAQEQGVWVQFGADQEGGRIVNPGFRAFACPHIIAACQRVIELLDGAPVKAIAAIDVDGLQREFEIPVEKTGKLLILMDALAALHEGLQASEKAGLAAGS